MLLNMDVTLEGYNITKTRKGHGACIINRLRTCRIYQIHRIYKIHLCIIYHEANILRT